MYAANRGGGWRFCVLKRRKIWGRERREEMREEKREEEEGGGGEEGREERGGGRRRRRGDRRENRGGERRATSHCAALAFGEQWALQRVPTKAEVSGTP